MVALSVKDFGARGDGVTDDSLAIQNGADAATKAGVSLLFPNGDYLVREQIIISGAKNPVHWIGEGFVQLLVDLPGARKLKGTWNRPKGAAFQFRGEEVFVRSLASNVSNGSRRISVNLGNNVEAGMLVGIQSNKAWYHDPRAPQGFVQHNAGQARGASERSVQLAQAALEKSYSGHTITVISGAGKGQARFITDYDTNTKVATVSPPWKVKPDATSRYVVPQAFKGELHRVMAVDGSVLELHAPLWDGYEVREGVDAPGNEVVQLTFYRPISVQVENIAFRWASRGLAREGTFQMLHIFAGYRCFLSKVSIFDVRGPAVQVERSYDCQFDDIRVEGADGKYTGYGLVAQCSYFITVNRGRFYGCRRSVDWSSTYNWKDPYPSRGCKVENSWSFGGSYRQDGLEWGAYSPGVDPQSSPVSAGMIDNFGFGSHGPADSNEYINNRVSSTHCGFLLRGRSERVVGNWLFGRLDYAVKIWFGSNHTIKDNVYNHNAVIGDREPGNFYTEFQSFDGLEWNSYMPKSFIQVVGTRSYWPMADGYLDVVGNVVRGVRRSFIELRLAGAKAWEDITLRDNHVTFWGASDSDEVFLVDTNSSANLVRFADIDNRLVLKRGQLKRYHSRNRVDRSSSVVHPLGPRSWWSKSLETTVQLQPDPEPQCDSTGMVILELDPVFPTHAGSSFRLQLLANVGMENDGGFCAIFLLREGKVLASAVAGPPQFSSSGNVRIDFVDTPVSETPIKYAISARAFHSSQVVINPVMGGGISLKNPASTTLFIEEI